MLSNRYELCERNDYQAYSIKFDSQEAMDKAFDICVKYGTPAVPYELEIKFNSYANCQAIQEQIVALYGLSVTGVTVKLTKET